MEPQPNPAAPTTTISQDAATSLADDPAIRKQIYERLEEQRRQLDDDEVASEGAAEGGEEANADDDEDDKSSVQGMAGVPQNTVGDASTKREEGGDVLAVAATGDDVGVSLKSEMETCDSSGNEFDTDDDEAKHSAGHTQSSQGYEMLRAWIDHINARMPMVIEFGKAYWHWALITFLTLCLFIRPSCPKTSLRTGVTVSTCSNSCNFAHVAAFEGRISLDTNYWVASAYLDLSLVLGEPTDDHTAFVTVNAALETLRIFFAVLPPQYISSALRSEQMQRVDSVQRQMLHAMRAQDSHDSTTYSASPSPPTFYEAPPVGMSYSSPDAGDTRAARYSSSCTPTSSDPWLPAPFAHLCALRQLYIPADLWTSSVVDVGEEKEGEVPLVPDLAAQQPLPKENQQQEKLSRKKTSTEQKSQKEKDETKMNRKADYAIRSEAARVSNDLVAKAVGALGIALGCVKEVQMQ